MNQLCGYRAPRPVHRCSDLLVLGLFPMSSGSLQPTSQCWHLNHPGWSHGPECLVTVATLTM